MEVPLTEQVFLKLGAEIKPCLVYQGEGVGSWQLNGKAISNSVQLDDYMDSLMLPLIADQWEVSAKFLVPFLEERDYFYQIIPGEEIGNLPKLYFMWKKEMHGFEAAEIKNHNIAGAACKAFMDMKL